MSESSSTRLAELAAAYRVATEFHDWRGRLLPVPASTIRAALGAMGVAAGTDDEVDAALLDVELAPWRRMLPPSLVARQGWTSWFSVHVPDGEQPQVWIELEDGGRRGDVLQRDHYVPPVMVDGELTGRATFELPPDLPLGYHRLCARLADDHRRQASCALVITPHRHELPPIPERSWGWVVQLYSLRSAKSWGVGDLGDLADLAVWSATPDGGNAGFVLINPLSAAQTSGEMEPSPYLPSSRRYVNPIYLRPNAITEFAELDKTARKLVGKLLDRAQSLNADGSTIDRDTAWQLKRSALAMVHQVPRSIGRDAEYAAFREREGKALADFAHFAALADWFGPDVDAWPEEYRRPDTEQVRQFAREHDTAVDFHCWLQWQCEDQLAAAQDRAVRAGMAYGVLGDLAVGVHPAGADTWAWRDVYANEISVGAPPDEFSQRGQNWSQPPLRPDVLAESGFEIWRELCRGLLRSTGGLRIDHIIGLFRLWWIPAGAASPAEGTYVGYDHEAMIGILLLEASRLPHPVVLVGEDLGTVQPWVRTYLQERGVLGTSLLWFEREEDGSPTPPERWRRDCLATVTTHDLPPTAGILAGEHIRLRNGLGLLTEPLEEVLAADERGRQDLIDALVERRLLPPGTTSMGRVVAALYAYVMATPARLIGVSLVDATGERRVQNLPGTDDEYPNWRVPLGDKRGNLVRLEALPGYRRLRRLLRVVNG